MDGRCNNLYNIYWGSALSPYWRFAPARYADDLQKPFGNDLHVVQSCCSIGLAMKDLPHRLSSEQSLSEHNVYLCVGNYNFTIVDFISLTNWLKAGGKCCLICRWIYLSSLGIDDTKVNGFALPSARTVSFIRLRQDKVIWYAREFRLELELNFWIWTLKKA